jgi:hypothetical protein
MIRLRQSRLGATLDGHRRRHELRSVEAFCMFIGYPRSGHSLLGSLLDAHPEMVIAHELDVLRLVATGWPRHALYSRIVNHDATFTASGRQWFGYDYRVPDQWQGRVSELRVIGDKKGGVTTERLGARPELLERLRRTVAVPVRLVHVVRSPYDNITTMARRSGQTLERAAGRYFDLCATVARVKQEVPESDVLDVRHEAFVSDPRAHLARACRFLGVEAPSAYLDACSGAVFSAPRQTRADLAWDASLVDRVAAEAARYEFLAGYSYAEEQQPT